MPVQAFWWLCPSQPEEGESVVLVCCVTMNVRKVVGPHGQSASPPVEPVGQFWSVLTRAWEWCAKNVAPIIHWASRSNGSFGQNSLLFIRCICWVDMHVWLCTGIIEKKLLEISRYREKACFIHILLSHQPISQCWDGVLNKLLSNYVFSAPINLKELE